MISSGSIMSQVKGKYLRYLNCIYISNLIGEIYNREERNKNEITNNAINSILIPNLERLRTTEEGDINK